MSVLKIYCENEDGVRQELAEVTGDHLVIGRNPNSDDPNAVRLKLPSDAVSSSHGEFRKLGGYWFYRDLGSTNGSFSVEGKMIPGRYFIVHNDDQIGFANVILKFEIAEQVIETLKQPALFVFYAGQLLQAWQFSSAGPALMLGGESSSLPLPEEFSQGNAVSVNFSQKSTLLQVYKASATAVLNESNLELNQEVKLEERDTLVLGDLMLLYNAGESVAKTKMTLVPHAQGTVIMTAEQAQLLRSNATGGFGKIIDEEPEEPEAARSTLALDQRAFSTQIESGSGDRLVYLIAIIGMILVLLILIWILLQ